MPSGIYQHKRGVYHHSEITIEKIRKSNTNNPKLNGFKKGNTFGFKKGQKAWNKDLTKYTSDIIMKQAINLTNKPLSPEHKAKSIKALENYRLANPISCIIGTHPTEETRLKLVKAHTNVPLSESHCKAISEGHKGLVKTKEHLKHLGESNKGKKRTEETKKKVSIGTKKGMDNEETRRKMREHRKKVILPVKDTKIEVKIQRFLESLGIDYFKHKYMNIEHGYQCDIFIPSLNLVVEADGNYWHKYPTGRDIDNIRTSELINNGFKVLRLWESEINSMDIQEFKQKIDNHANI